jgi:hypothetical protein
MSLDLNPEVESQVLERARAAGTTASEYIARLLRSDAPAPSPSDPIARVRELRQQDDTPTALPPPNDGTMTPSEALFRQWEREDAALTDEERQAEEALWQQFQQGINAERDVAGMRRLF